ncbi:hypothetical protein D918_06968 [Trichuris suis]|nr:hypothetical protein D918_06968 [Trichuris suis]
MTCLLSTKTYETFLGESDVEAERDQRTNTAALETDFFGFTDHSGSSFGSGVSVSLSSCLPTSVCYDTVLCHEAERASVSPERAFPTQTVPQTTSFDQNVIPCESGSPKSLYPYEYGPPYEQTCQGMSSTLTDEQARSLISKFEAEPFGRSMPDTLHIVDVRVDDYMRDVRENVLRNVTLAKPQSSFNTVVPADEKDKPTVVAKRKHQITYLAHLAKEREGQLEQQWAQNRQRRREARLKYGF